MSIPTAAIEAAAEALGKIPTLAATLETHARVAIEAALPAIREHIAQEIETFIDSDSWWLSPDERRTAAQIVRGDL